MNQTAFSMQTIRFFRREYPTTRANMEIYRGFRRQGIAPATALANTLALSI